MSDALVFCSSCGQTLLANAPFCPHCGAALAPVPASAMSPAMAAPGSQMYGGFWIRFAALLIDSVVQNLVLAPIFLLVFGTSLLAMGRPNENGQVQPNPAIFALLPLLLVIATVGSWLYEAFLTSSSWQGTIGKKALGLKVTDINGRRLSFGHATGRFFAKMINGFTMGIGWIMAGFTQRRQGLHDMIAGTLVLKS